MLAPSYSRQGIPDLACGRVWRGQFILDCACIRTNTTRVLDGAASHGQGSTIDIMLRSCLFYMVVSAAIIVSEALLHEVSDELYALRYSIPGGGIPGEDYPILAVVPDTEFSCDEESKEGYYPDPYTFCQVFHICHQGIKWTKDSFLCPNGTIFNADKKGCDWWFDSECSSQLAQGSRIVPRISHGFESEKLSLGSGFVRKTLPPQTPDVSSNQFHTSLSKENSDAAYHPVSELLASQKFENVQHLGSHDIVRSSNSDQNSSPAEVNSALNHFINTGADINNASLIESHSNTLIHSSNPNGFSYSYSTKYESPANNPNLRTSIIREPSPTFTQNQPEYIDSIPEESLNQEYNSKNTYTNSKDTFKNVFDEGLSSSQFGSNFNNNRSPSLGQNTPSLLQADDDSLTGLSPLGYPSQGTLPNLSGTLHPQLKIEDNSGHAGINGFDIPSTGHLLPSSSINRHPALGVEGNISPPKYTGIGIPLPGRENNFGHTGNTNLDIPLSEHAFDNSRTRQSSFKIEDNVSLPGNVGFGVPIPGAVPDTSGIRQSSFGIEDKVYQPGATGQGIPLPETFTGSSGDGFSSLGINDNIDQTGATGVRIPSHVIINNVGHSEDTAFGFPLSGHVSSNSGIRQTSFEKEDDVSLPGNFGFGVPIPGAVPGTSGIRSSSFGFDDNFYQPEATGQGIPLQESFAGSNGDGFSSLGIKENIGRPGATGVGIPLPEILPSLGEPGHALLGIEENYGLDVTTGLGTHSPSHNESIYSPLGIENNIHSVWQASSNEENNQQDNTDLGNHPQTNLVSFDTHSGVDYSFSQVGTSSGFRNPSNGVLASLSSTRGIPVECRQTRTDAELSPELSALRTNIWGGGVPGVDYPVLSSIVRTRFLCQDYAMDGFYADPEACCQVFHRCFNRGRGSWEQESFLCPNGTIFNQKVNTCIRWNEPYWWDGVSCSESEKFYPSRLSNDTYQEGFETNANLTLVSGEQYQVGSDGFSSPVEFNEFDGRYTEGSQFANEISIGEIPKPEVFGDYALEAPVDLPVSAVLNDYVTINILNVNDYVKDSNEDIDYEYTNFDASNFPATLNVADNSHFNINPTSNTRVTDISDVSISNTLPSNNLPNFAAGDKNFDKAWGASSSDFTGRAAITPSEHKESHLDPSSFTFNEPDPTYALSVSFGTKDDPANNVQSFINATSLEDTDSKENDKTYIEYDYTNVDNEFISDNFNEDTNYDVNFNSMEALHHNSSEATIGSEIFLFHNNNESLLEQNNPTSFIENANNFESNTGLKSNILDIDETTDSNYFTNFYDEVESNEEVNYYYDSQVNFQDVHTMVNNLSPKPIDDKGNPVLDINPTKALEPSFSSAIPSKANNAFTFVGPDQSYTIASTFGADSSLSVERINIITISLADASSVSPASATSNPSVISISIKPSTVFNGKTADTQTTDINDFGAEFW